MADQFPEGFKLTDYEYLKDLPIEGWVWEFMRRNKEDRAILKSKEQPGHPLIGWGLIQDPDLTYPLLREKNNGESIFRSPMEIRSVQDPSVFDDFGDIVITCKKRKVKNNKLLNFFYNDKRFFFRAEFDIRYSTDKLQEAFFEKVKKIKDEIGEVWRDDSTYTPAQGKKHKGDKSPYMWIEGLPLYDLVKVHRMDPNDAGLLLHAKGWWPSVITEEKGDELRTVTRAAENRYKAVSSIIKERRYVYLLIMNTSS